MNEQFYTVEQIAQTLNIHPKTIQRYIREGKLNAAKIGKGWRVTGHDLSRFIEENNNSFTERPTQALKQERVKASAVLDIKVYSKDEANRIINALTASMNVKPPEFGQASMFAQFLEMDFTVRLTLWGNIQFMSAILDSVEVFLKQYEEDKLENVGAASSHGVL